jgi:hypothetical protein
MNASTTSTTRVRTGFAVVAVIIAVLLPGCANYQARVADGKPLQPEYQGGMMSAYAWGSWVSPEIMSAEECKPERCINPTPQAAILRASR